MFHEMDELFDRIKAIKIKRKKLFLPLILTEVLGILVLLWFLRLPLTQKYLTFAPISYQVETMDPDKQYLLRQGDFITGKTSPNSTLALLLYPGSKHALLTDSRGNFSFQIPGQTPPAEYRLIIINDRNRLETFKDLRIRVSSNNKLDGLGNLFR